MAWEFLSIKSYFIDVCMVVEISLLYSTKVVPYEYFYTLWFINMIKINKLTDYAAIVMKFLVSCDGAVSASYIAEHTNISLPMVRKVLKKLNKAELIYSIQGHQGGYVLLKDPKDISLAVLICAIDGDLALADCLTEDSSN